MSDKEACWERLRNQATRLKDKQLRDVLHTDSNRFDALSCSLGDLLYDYSRELLDVDVVSDLIRLAQQAGFEKSRNDLFHGEKINFTEDRAVQHMALRKGIEEDPSDNTGPGSISASVNETLERCFEFAESVRNGNYKSVSGKIFTDIVNIGIGGSDLGPSMVTKALAPWCNGPKVHFVSNVDGADILDTLSTLDPRSTLIIVASKTFTTSETMLNFRTAMDWLSQALGENTARHIAAVSTNLEATRAYGLDDERVFGFWDWVGGRYSVWSSIGLPVIMAVGRDTFQQFLDGARLMDEHFFQAPLDRNIPVLSAMIGIWRRNILNYPTVAIIPYDQHLARFPAYVQQLDMESNGKQVTRDGRAVTSATAPVIWGEPGTNAQHSFFQLIHQGTDVVPVDFILSANPSVSSNQDQAERHHRALMCNALAQMSALALGRRESEVRQEMLAEGANESEIGLLAKHRTFPGNRPSSMYLLKKLTPFALGQLIALFEHKVFVQGVIWDINSFDQWGVELGKKLAKELAVVFEAGEVPESLDQSTKGLVRVIHALQGD